MIYTCNHIGLAGITSVFIKKSPVKRDDGYTHKYEARMGIAIFGSVMDENSIGGNPFDEKFFDNYVKGVGFTEEVALQKLKEDFEDMHKSIWAE